jgi:hypothetical protein
LSIAAQDWARSVTTGSPTRKSILLALANYANKDGGSCYPRIKKLWQDTELSDAAIRKALIELEHLGAISRNMRRGARGEYTLNLAWQGINCATTQRTFRPRKRLAEASDCATTQRTHGDEVRHQEAHSAPPRSAPLRHDAAHPLPPRSAPLLTVIEPSMESTNEPSAKRRAKSRKHQIPDDWQPASAERHFAAEQRIDVEHTAEEFRSYWKGRGDPRADWDQTFRNRLIQLTGRRSSPTSGRRGGGIAAGRNRALGALGFEDGDR